MKKLLVLGFVALAVAALSLGVFSQVSAQSGTTGTGRGQGAGGFGMHGMSLDEETPLHDYMIAAWADKLSLTVKDIETRLDAGETLSDIALSTGLILTDFRSTMLEVRSSAIVQAVADGVLTQDQADLMNQASSRMFGRGMRGMGRGSGMNCLNNGSGL